MDQHHSRLEMEADSLLRIINGKTKQIMRVLNLGKQHLKTQASFSSECAERTCKTSLYKFISAKLETIVSARDKLRRSRNCKKCISEARDIVESPTMNFCQLERQLKLLMKKAALNELQEMKDSDLLINELIEYFAKQNKVAKRNVTELKKRAPTKKAQIDWIERLSTNSLEQAKRLLKEETNKIYTEEEEFVIKENCERVETEAAHIIMAIDDIFIKCATVYENEIGFILPGELLEHKAFFDGLFPKLSVHMHQLNLLYEELRAEQRNNCMNCLMDKMEEINMPQRAKEIGDILAVLEACEDTVKPTRHMKAANITKEMIDKEKTICCVCMSAVTLEDDSALSCPGCEKVYNEECIGRWLTEKDTCPACRYKLRRRIIDINISEESTRIHLN